MVQEDRPKWDIVGDYSRLLFRNKENSSIQLEQTACPRKPFVQQTYVHLLGLLGEMIVGRTQPQGQLGQLNSCHHLTGGQQGQMRVWERTIPTGMQLSASSVSPGTTPEHWALQEATPFKHQATACFTPTSLPWPRHEPPRSCISSPQTPPPVPDGVGRGPRALSALSRALSATGWGQMQH